MKDIFAFSLVLFLSLLPNDSKSCAISNTTDEERVADAKSIFVGQITGIRYDKKEKGLAREGRHYSAKFLEIDFYTLRVFVTETLKGRPKKILEIESCSCGCGSGSLNDTVIVFKSRDGSFYVSSDKELITTVEKIPGK